MKAPFQQPLKSPLVLAGDFNCPADDPALSPIRTRMVDTCSAVDVTGAREADAVGTMVLYNIRIDHIFFDPRYLSVNDAGLLPESHRLVSDHIGYHADLF
ncbi:MAG: endonuclease/exonuclease/phosphatase family protein [Desulfosarcina sp.]|nr:endonuclease/exonuclease/phosphatase family protein [Desulfosarcina sp.]MBC2742229.1 endonuclease/exonuclease/phosphatase family protein [Desulfosarcina sp.]MBC2765141.1 endonuclease/exonuclease/phosphatase family protein [Desulfosarcina sp.]